MPVDNNKLAASGFCSNESNIRFSITDLDIEFHSLS
nr:MAG TPA: hypothetical protein [Caudoviricetes sp.]